MFMLHDIANRLTARRFPNHQLPVRGKQITTTAATSKPKMSSSLPPRRVDCALLLLEGSVHVCVSFVYKKASPHVEIQLSSVLNDTAWDELGKTERERA